MNRNLIPRIVLALSLSVLTASATLAPLSSTFAAHAEPFPLEENDLSKVELEKVKMKRLQGSIDGATTTGCNINIGSSANNSQERGSKAVLDVPRTVVVTGSVYSICPGR